MEVLYLYLYRYLHFVVENSERFLWRNCSIDGTVPSTEPFRWHNGSVSAMVLWAEWFHGRKNSRDKTVPMDSTNMYIYLSIYLHFVVEIPERFRWPDRLLWWNSSLGRQVLFVKKETIPICISIHKFICICIRNDKVPLAERFRLRNSSIGGMF